MFTWIPIHEETAKRLLEFKDHNHELVEIIGRMHEAGLKATLINDQGPNGSLFQIKEFDPFSFLANFNRGTKDANRKSMWQILKNEWKLQSEVPQDFDGLPLANAQNSWLMPYAKDRSSEHVPLLWKFFEHIMTVEPEFLDADLMQQCLDLPRVGLTMLTMGMFWACPKKWISTDGKNIGYAATKGITGKPGNAVEYREWLPKIREVIGEDAVDFSRQAHLSAIQDKHINQLGAPFHKIFRTADPAWVLDFFAKIMNVLKGDRDQPETHLVASLRANAAYGALIRLNYGRWAVAAIIEKAGRPLIEILLPVDHPRYRSWREVSAVAGMAEADGRAETTEGFADIVDGVQYGLSYFDYDEFVALETELSPQIETGLRAVMKCFESHKGSPYRNANRPELWDLILKPEKRSAILAKGIADKQPGVRLAKGNT